MSLLDSEEILDNNADIAVLTDHLTRAVLNDNRFYRGIVQELPSFDECEIGDIFWVRDESKFYIRDFENWHVISPLDVTPNNIFLSTIIKCDLADQGPKNYRIKLNNPQTITGIGDLYHGSYDVDISTVKINYSNETI